MTGIGPELKLQIDNADFGVNPNIDIKCIKFNLFIIFFPYHIVWYIGKGRRLILKVVFFFFFIMNLISGISSLLAIGILTPVQSILWLIILFLSTAISLYNNDFVLMGILYIMIYVGAIAILFLFILSLLKIDYKAKSDSNPLVITLLIISFIPLDLSYNPIGLVQNLNDTYNELVTVGLQFYTEYAVLLVITGLILILSVVGAIAIVK